MIFDEGEDKRLASCLRRLLPHIDAAAVALTGGVAIGVQFEAPGKHRPRRLLHDVDLVARRPDAVSPSVAEAFFISHFHVPHPGYPRFMLQLVEPKTRLRIDIFLGETALIEEAKTFEVCGTRIRVLSLNAILNHKLALLAGASAHRPVDRKHYADAMVVASVFDRTLGEMPENYFADDEYSLDTQALCCRCDYSSNPEWPLTSKEQIFDVLGYV